MYICALDQGKFEAFDQSIPDRCILVVDLESGAIDTKIPTNNYYECDGLEIYNKKLYYEENSGYGDWRLIEMWFE